MNVLKSNSFEFVECVSNSNWKYFNLSKEGDHFLNHYYSGHRFKKARIILKTKNSAGVANAGLLPNQCYKLVSIHNENPQAGV